MDADAALPLSLAASGIAGAAPAVAAAAADPAAARKTAEDFESFFLAQSFETMFSGVEADAVFGGGSAEAVYRSLLLQEYSKVAARRGGIGIANAVQREILRTQEKR
ncbi:MAG TPA: rod-binding protein [Stellaceae bacterium]|nr:rod-binding protein [Stellaceae bacterium]